jgi:hypothetical protein
LIAGPVEESMAESDPEKNSVAAPVSS